MTNSRIPKKTGVLSKNCFRHQLQLSVTNFFLKYNQQSSDNLFENFNLKLYEGEILAILGASGTGKTSLLNGISGLTPANGKISYKKKLGYVMQNDLFLPWRTVLENILLPLELNHKLTLEKVILAKNYLEQMGMENYANSFPNQISGGMKQKASIVRILTQNPDILLLDEPFSGLDFISKLELIKLVRYNFKIQNKSVIVATHNIDDAISMADRILVLKGKPVQTVLNLPIFVSGQYRDPVEIRKTKIFNQIFHQIYEIFTR